MSETFCVRNKCFPVCAAWIQNKCFVSRSFAHPRNIMSNNVSATLCPRLPPPVDTKLSEKSNFEISKGVPIKTRVQREVIMVITLHAFMVRSEKNNAKQNSLGFTTKKKTNQNALSNKLIL